MVTVKESVINQLVFEKIGTYELPKNISEWDQEILDQFFEQINYLPKEFGTDVIVKNVDENEGYAKGSVAVWYQNKQINFPVIVKNFQLSPFDIFVYRDGDKTKYVAANLKNIKKVLMSEQLGTPKNKYPRGAFEAIKPVGGIYPKTPVSIQDVPDLAAYPHFAKMSGWPIKADKEAIEKLAVQMETDENVGKNFIDNTGDLVGNIIELNRHNRIIGDDHKDGILDTYKVVKAKRAVTILDSQFIDVNQLKPMIAPTVCELRMYEYPSMEDFIESGKNMASRFLASTTGKPLSGIILDMTDSYDLNQRFDEPETCYPVDKNTEKKNERQRRNQIFISLDGKYYCKYDDYNRTGIGFYGSNVLTQEGALQKAIQYLAKRVTDDLINIDPENKNDGSDKNFLAVHKEMQQIMDQGKKDDGYYGEVPSSRYGQNLLIIYGADDAFECLSFGRKFRKYRVNNSNVYVSREEAIIPANVASVQRVKTVLDPVYKMILGKVNKIFLIPEGSLVINASMMKCLNREDFLRPSKSIQKIYEDANINKVALYVKDGGYCIAGDPFEPLNKVAHLNGNPLTTDQTYKALAIMGMGHDDSAKAMKTALEKYANTDNKNKKVIIYGVNNDYIDTGVIKHLDKMAKIKQIIRDECSNLRINLIKEASVLDDPEAVDVVLSLNFINEDNLNGYIENVREMKKVSGDLAELLVASRMGLSTVDDGAVKKAMDGLETVIENLEEIKLAIE